METENQQGAKKAPRKAKEPTKPPPKEKAIIVRILSDVVLTWN
jgi:hypothetical protein